MIKIVSQIIKQVNHLKELKLTDLKNNYMFKGLLKSDTVQKILIILTHFLTTNAPVHSLFSFVYL